MTNHPHSMLNAWYPKRDQQPWVLGSVTAVQGSSYRKPGAMMLFNGLGQMLGMLSGGCVEKSLFEQVKRVLVLGQPVSTRFDATARAQVAWQMGLGCGGVVDILLQPVHAGVGYQALDRLHAELQAGRAATYSINLAGERNAYGACSGAHWLPVPVRPRTHLVILGAGLDALPLARLALAMDWQVSLVDHRPGFADPAGFAGVEHIVRERAAAPEVAALLAGADAAMIMTHNVSLDAEALSAACAARLHYIGLLGPAHRKQRVLDKAGLAADPRLHGPMGLALGGELPEAVALSALAQCHQVLAAAGQAESAREGAQA